jgi:hypothetical protein
MHHVFWIDGDKVSVEYPSSWARVRVSRKQAYCDSHEKFHAYYIQIFMESLCFSCQDAWCFMNPSYLMHAHIHSVGIYVHPSNKQFCALQSRRQLGHVIQTLNIIEIEVCNVLAQ